MLFTLTGEIQSMDCTGTSSTTKSGSVPAKKDDTPSILTLFPLTLTPGVALRIS